MLPANLYTTLVDSCHWFLSKNQTKPNKYGKIPRPQVKLTFNNFYNWEKISENFEDNFIFAASPLVAALQKSIKDVGNSNLPIPVPWKDVADCLQISVEEALHLQYIFEGKEIQEGFEEVLNSPNYGEIKIISDKLKELFSE